MKPNPCAQNATLQCELEAIRVIAARELRMEFPADNCCDMTGAIRLATAVMPNCQRIVTTQGGHLDTVYTRRSGHWTAELHEFDAFDVFDVNSRISTREEKALGVNRETASNVSNVSWRHAG